MTQQRTWQEEIIVWYPYPENPPAEDCLCLVKIEVDDEHDCPITEVQFEDGRWMQGDFVTPYPEKVLWWANYPEGPEDAPTR